MILVAVAQHSPTRSDARIGAVVSLLAFALAFVCIKLTAQAGGLSAIWLANAVVLAFLLKSEARRWPTLAVGAIFGNLCGDLAAGHGLASAATLTLANAFEYMACAATLRRALGPQIDLSRTRDLAWIGFTCVAASVMSAGLVPLMLGGLHGSQLLSSLVTWTLTDSLGLLIVTPALLTLSQAGQHLQARPMTLGGWLSVLAVIATVGTVFSQNRYSFLFVIPPALLLLAVQMEVLGAVAGVLLTAVVAIALSMLGRGPLHLVTGGLGERAIVLQLFLAVATFVSLPFAAMSARSRRLQQEAFAARDEAEEHARRALLAERVAGLGHWRLELESNTISWSDQMYVIYGLEPDAPLDLHRLSAMTHPDDREASEEQLARVIASSDFGRRTVSRIQRADGHVRHLTSRMSSETGPDGRVVAVVGTVMDITGQVAAQARIARSEARYRLLADNASDLITQCDLDGKFTYISPAIQALTGYTADELMGRPALELIHPDDTDALRSSVQAQIVGGARPVAVEYRIRHKSGEEVWFEARPTVALDPDTGRVRGITDIARDITRRKTLESSLRAARAEAEKAASVKSEFMANMSHELRTPLTAVIGFSKLAAEQPELGQDARRFLNRVNTGAKALLATVNDILDFSKLEAGQVEIKPRAMAPGALASETFALFTDQARAKGITLRAGGLDALPDAVSADPDRIRQILLNLLGNAVKFTETGHVSLRAAYDSTHEALRFEVSDSGGGIPADHIGQLFQRFSQIDGSSTRSHGGTGLGLAICKGLVEAMGGRIGVQSQPGQGSSFWFCFPAPTVQLAAEKDAVHTDALPSCRVLVADDNAFNRELVRSILGASGVNVAEAEDGEVAVALAQSEAFDVILMDLRMPRLDGRGAAARIRSEAGPCMRTPIIAFSASQEYEADVNLFDGWIAKPLAIASMLETISSVLNSSARISSATTQTSATLP